MCRVWIYNVISILSCSNNTQVYLYFCIDNTYGQHIPHAIWRLRVRFHVGLGLLGWVVPGGTSGVETARLFLHCCGDGHSKSRPYKKCLISWKCTHCPEQTLVEEGWLHPSTIKINPINNFCDNLPYEGSRHMVVCKNVLAGKHFLLIFQSRKLFISRQ